MTTNDTRTPRERAANEAWLRDLDKDDPVHGGCFDGYESQQEAFEAGFLARDAEVPEYDTLAGCTGCEDCPAPAHQHGCFADLKGHCNEPESHPARARHRDRRTGREGGQRPRLAPERTGRRADRMGPSEVAEEIEDCKPLAELVFRAAGFRIEGDEA